MKVPDVAECGQARGDRRAGRRPRLRQARDRPAAGQRGRQSARQRLPGGRVLHHRHHQVREAGHRPGDPHLGPGSLHRLRQVRARLPPRRHPHEGVRALAPRGRARGLPLQGLPRQGAARPQADDPGVARRLHRVRRLRQRLPGEEQPRGAAQGHRHGAGGGAPRRGARELGVLRRDPDARPGPDAARLRPGLTGAGATLRVLRRLRRVRRDALRQARLAAVRRPDRGRQRHRLLVHLRRQSADDSLDRRSQRARAGVEQLPVRGRRRVRDGHAPGLQGTARAGQGSSSSASRRGSTRTSCGRS